MGGSQCTTVYTPPAGKAIVLTSVTYDLGSGSAGVDAFITLLDKCPAGFTYDIGDTTQGHDTFQHTFPAGLPLTGLAAFANRASGLAYTGYLIPISQLPPTSQIPQVSRHRLAKLHMAKPTK